jgi:hypothetical protein
MRFGVMVGHLPFWVSASFFDELFVFSDFLVQCVSVFVVVG